MVSREIGWMNHISRKVVLLLVIVLSCQLSSLAPHASAASPGTEAMQGSGKLLPHHALWSDKDGSRTNGRTRRWHGLYLHRWRQSHCEQNLGI